MSHGRFRKHSSYTNAATHGNYGYNGAYPRDRSYGLKYHDENVAPSAGSARGNELGGRKVYNLGAKNGDNIDHEKQYELRNQQQQQRWNNGNRFAGERMFRYDDRRRNSSYGPTRHAEHVGRWNNNQEPFQFKPHASKPGALGAKVAMANDEERHNGHTIYVGNIPSSVPESELRYIFRRFGSIQELFLKRPLNGGPSYAFVTYFSPGAVNRALMFPEPIHLGNLLLQIRPRVKSVTRSSQDTMSRRGNVDLVNWNGTRTPPPQIVIDHDDNDDDDDGDVTEVPMSPVSSSSDDVSPGVEIQVAENKKGDGIKIEDISPNLNATGEPTGMHSKVVRIEGVPGGWNAAHLFSLFSNYGKVDCSYLYDDRDEFGKRSGLVQIAGAAADNLVTRVGALIVQNNHLQLYKSELKSVYDTLMYGSSREKICMGVPADDPMLDMYYVPSFAPLQPFQVAPAPAVAAPPPPPPLPYGYLVPPVSYYNPYVPPVVNDTGSATESTVTESSVTETAPEIESNLNQEVQPIEEDKPPSPPPAAPARTYVRRGSPRNFQQQKSSPTGQLFVKFLDKSLIQSDDDLQLLFCVYGELEECILCKYPSGESREFGFVTFVRSEDAASALKAMNRKTIGSNSLYVKFAIPK